MKFLSTCEADTIQCATDFAQTLKGNEIVALDGTLGMGKTVFARAIIQALTHSKTDVPSPTFTLLQTYETSIGPLYHFDFYRLKDPMEAYEVGIEDAFYDGICLIEWPEKIKGLLPTKTIFIHFQMTPKGRVISWEK